MTREGRGPPARAAAGASRTVEEVAMGYVNRVFTIGTISRPPVLRWIKENLAIADFAVHVENQYTTKDGRHVVKDFTLEFVAFGETAERSAAAVGEGMRVFVQGRLKMETKTAP